MAAATRRSVLVAIAGAAAAAALPAFALAAGDAAVAVFDSADPAARAFAAARADRLAVDGDRVRFARKLFGEHRPATVVAMTRYADWLVLSEAAREHGYRPALAGRTGGLFAWTAERA